MRRITQGLVLLLVLGLGVGLVSCGGDDDDFDDIAGTYVGQIFDNIVGAGTLTVVIAQNGNNLVGSYTTVFGVVGGAGFGNGDLTGVINGSTISLTAVPRANARGCVFTVNANSDDDDLNGTYTSGNCPAEAGRFDISR